MLSCVNYKTNSVVKGHFLEYCINSESSKHVSSKVLKKLKIFFIFAVGGWVKKVQKW